MRKVEVVEYFGSETAVADALGIRQPSVNEWGEYPPDARQLQIERLTKKALRAEPGCLDRLLGMDKLNPESV